ncbi:MAG: sulfurtransferase-like selenium metabolism protein YedF [bacterium]|nr:sulfurtransferase-like selenium metabolism protein YedF [bacterium]
MSETIDARGLVCPQPVILAKKAMETHSSITVQVDNRTAVENITRLGNKEGKEVRVTDQQDGSFEIHLSGEPAQEPGTGEMVNSGTGPFVIVFSSDRMGRGDDELGYVLVKGFIHALLELPRRPEVMIFYNTGVKLAAEGSDTIPDLKELESRGTELLICGTCVNYFELTGKTGAGSISNMYDIAGTMSQAGRLVVP